jgi:hypothetical protein
MTTALIAALMRDPDVASCARESDATARAYVSRAFALRDVRLRGGVPMTLAEANDACLALGQSTRIYIFERSGATYRRVLRSVTIPGLADVKNDGTAILPTHETPATILESAYVWTGRTYAFSASLTRVYDVPLEQRRPYQRIVEFVPGTSAQVLTGSTAGTFGDHYVFRARRGQRATIALLRYANARPEVVLASGDRSLAVVAGHRWAGRLPATGSYDIFVFGGDGADPEVLVPYAIRLGIE